MVRIRIRTQTGHCTRACITAILMLLAGRVAPVYAAGWTTLVNLSPEFPGTMILLTDGTVLVQASNSASGDWMRLTPDIHGSYVDGTWSLIPPMSRPRLYFASNVLTDGRLWVLGGEYSGVGLPANWTPTGEIFDPLANAWSPIASYPADTGCPGSQAACFGDDPSMLLPGGMILAGDLVHPTPHIYNIATDTWSPAGRKVYDDQSDEESWVKMADGSILTYDIFQSFRTGTGYAERYDPATDTWSSISPADGTANGFLPVLSSPSIGYELGPALRLQDGRVLILGANGHTALYDVSTNTWSAGPDIIGTLNGQPALFGADDAPGAEMPNGHILFAADAGPTIRTFSPPTQLFDFDPSTNTISPVDPPIPDPSLDSKPSFVTRMLVLPNGQVLFNDDSRELYVYTPDGPVVPEARPVINSVEYNGGGVFTLTGKQINGQSAASSYGDDVESDENFPVIRLVAGGNTYYARTTNWSTVGVDDDGSEIQSVDFTLNAGTTAGNYALLLTGSGIPSFPIFITITQAEIDGQ